MSKKTGGGIKVILTMSKGIAFHRKIYLGKFGQDESKINKVFYYIHRVSQSFPDLKAVTSSFARIVDCVV